MDFPSKCPYCGKDIQPNLIVHIWEHGDFYNTACNNGLKIELHRCIHCKKPICVVKKESVVGDKLSSSNIIYYYPISNCVELPKRIQQLSPIAYKTYQQTIKAKEQDYNMLIGAGLRIALEWLIWDYLIKVKGKSKAELEKLTLYKRIELMNANFYTEVCTRLIRLFGNDSVHIIKQLDFSIDEVIEIFNMLCVLIDSELRINEVNERLPKKP